MFSPIAIYSQNKSIEGQILDPNKAPISFVNILLYENEGSQTIAGTTTNEMGFFNIDNLEEKEYFWKLE